MDDDKKPGNYFEGPYRAEVNSNRLMLEMQNYIDSQIGKHASFNDRYNELMFKGVNDKIDAYMKSTDKATVLREESTKVHFEHLNNSTARYLAQLNTSATKDQVRILENDLKERISDLQKVMSQQLDAAIENLQKQITDLQSGRDTLSGGFQATKIIANLGYLLAGLIIGGLAIWFNFFKG